MISTRRTQTSPAMGSDHSYSPAFSDKFAVSQHSSFQPAGKSFVNHGHFLAGEHSATEGGTRVGGGRP